MPRLPGRPSTRDPDPGQTDGASVGPVRGSVLISDEPPLGDPGEPFELEIWDAARQARNLEIAKATAPKRKPKLCVDCEQQPKKNGHPLWCGECWLRRQPIEVQAQACARRAARVTEAQYRAVVPAAEWPAGRRWCAGCQTMRSLVDFKDGASRCIPCASTAAHRSRIERTYDISRIEYEELLKLQDSRCAICRSKFVSKRPAIDHDHASGMVRGLLCDGCNNELLGSAASHGDHSSAGAIRILLAALHYLRNPPMSGRWRVEAAESPPPF